MRVKENYSLKDHNSFGIDVAAAHFVRAESIKDLQAAIALQIRPTLILGSGSNMLFSKRYEGLIIHNAIPNIEIIEEESDHSVIEVGGGVVWHELVMWCVSRDFGGLENLSLIPGTVGAAPIQNIGAYGVEFDQIFEGLDAIEIATNQSKTFAKQDCRFGYRTSIFKNDLKGQYVITKVRMKVTKDQHTYNTSYGAIEAKLKEGNKALTIETISEAVIQIRQSKLPDPSQVGNAGSFFKNPIVSNDKFDILQQNYPDVPSYPMGSDEVKIPAAWLIEKCGWKGYRRGDAGIYQNHALVLVNHGHATGAELFELAMGVQSSVQEIFDITLEPEVNIY